MLVVKMIQNTMLAVANGGLIGSVKDVASHSSRVNLLTNNKNVDNISVRIQTETSTIYGVIVGYSKEKICFHYQSVKQFGYN